MFELIRREDFEHGYYKIQLWDTVHTSLLDCWIVSDHDDARRCCLDLNEIFRGQAPSGMRGVFSWI